MRHPCSPSCSSAMAGYMPTGASCSLPAEAAGRTVNTSPSLSQFAWVPAPRPQLPPDDVSLMWTVWHTGHVVGPMRAFLVRGLLSRVAAAPESVHVGALAMPAGVCAMQSTRRGLPMLTAHAQARPRCAVPEQGSRLGEKRTSLRALIFLTGSCAMPLTRVSAYPCGTLMLAHHCCHACAGRMRMRTF